MFPVSWKGAGGGCPFPVVSGRLITMREVSGPREGRSSTRDDAVTIPGYCNTCTKKGCWSNLRTRETLGDAVGTLDCRRAPADCSIYGT
ncbi:hypothetical protein QFZ67_004316 [Streptomyces sp. V1I1]|nr:hypothetical protein [Streptomyces sp. V1I1]